jgi:hypothetical protein
MMRDSPPELARLFAAPYASSRRTDFPSRRSRYAIQAPNTPAPTTATSCCATPMIAALLDDVIGLDQHPAASAAETKVLRFMTSSLS